MIYAFWKDRRSGMGESTLKGTRVSQRQRRKRRGCSGQNERRNIRNKKSTHLKHAEEVGSKGHSSPSDMG